MVRTRAPTRYNIKSEVAGWSRADGDGAGGTEAGGACRAGDTSGSGSVTKAPVALQAL